MENKGFYEGEYMPKMHKIGKLTGFLGAILSFLPALVLGSCLWTSSETGSTWPPHLFPQPAHSDFSGS